MHLHRHHGERVAILIDEYDAPLHAGYLAGYYDRVVRLFRNFLSAGLKDNPHLWKGVLTGILRVARESIFSGLKNLIVYSVLSSAYATSFGFTKAEVAGLAESAGRAAALPDMDRWYDGYRFGGEVLYNPWSVLACLASTEASPLQPYWVGTSALALVRDLLLARAGEDERDIELLLRGKSITKRIDENIARRDLSPDDDAVWGLLHRRRRTARPRPEPVAGPRRGRSSLRGGAPPRRHPVRIPAVPALSGAGDPRGRFPLFLGQGPAPERSQRLLRAFATGGIGARPARVGTS